MKFGLESNVIERIMEVFQSFPGLDEAIIYGSRALGTYKQGSDIDLTFKGALSFEDLLKIEVQLEEIMLPYTFDLSLYSSLENQELLEHIERVGKTFYKKKKLNEKNKRSH